jgi:hypothetical protein
MQDLVQQIDVKKEHRKSLLSIFLSNSSNPDLATYLKSSNILFNKYQFAIDLHNSNTLERCFDKEHPQQDTSKMLITQALKMKKSFYSHNIIMSIVQRVLDDSDDFESFSNFFVDFLADNKHNQEQDHLCFSYHMRNNLLKYSDKSN